MALEPFSVALLEPGDALDPPAWILCAKCILPVEPHSHSGNLRGGPLRTSGAKEIVKTKIHFYLYLLT